VLIILIFTLIRKSNYFPPPVSEKNWRKNTDHKFIKSLGINPIELEEFGRWNLENNLDKESLTLNACLVIKNGWIIGEWYSDKDGSHNFNKEYENRQVYLPSLSKALTIALFGILLEEKKAVQYNLSLNSNIYDKRWLTDGYPLSDPRKMDITIDHIFSHTSGLLPDCIGIISGTGKSNYDFILGKHPIYTKSAQLYFDPGKPEQFEMEFSSSDLAFDHMLFIIENIANQPAHIYLESALLHRIGIHDIIYNANCEWSNQGVKWIPSKSICLNTRDFARFAYFIMKNGIWNNEQLTKKGYLENILSNKNYPDLSGDLNSGNKMMKKFATQFLKSPQSFNDLIRVGGALSSWAYIIPSQEIIAIRIGEKNRINKNILEKIFLEKLFNIIE